ncbi:ParA family protein [Roseospirillum parvum]|uniref:Cellulose biosynthesis protein BcsQ n=1 Tax=Roseospirillum parvum TaxID=83401 RepID=A0A1G7Z4Y5_9PROT|nr:ParA family protein [Roseospirillum parvum]SDH03659.1 Cellulose biosynthesis protein BcsQ [Roseospirillum parvum]
MRTLACYAIKGGVGKTAGAVNLAWLAAEQGYRVILWDLDPQGAASFYLGVKAKVKGAAGKLLKDKDGLAERLRPSAHANLDLLPADFRYRHMDRQLDDHKKPEQRLGKLLAGLRKHADLVILDCPPSVSLVSENVFTAADAILTPLIPTTLSLRTLAQLRELGREVAAEVGRPPTPIWPYLSMIDRRKRLHREIAEQVAAAEPDLMGDAIPYASAVEQMGLERQPLPLFAPRSPATQAFRNLWRDVDGRLFGPRLAPVAKRATV